VDTAAFGPTLEENTSSLTHTTLMEFLQPQLGLAIGKF
jgi:hypothetical protein